TRAGLALVEAEGRARPLVSMEAELARMTTEPARAALLERDLREFQQHLLALSQDRMRCDEMGRAAAGFVARSFTLDVRERQIEELLLGHKPVSTMSIAQPSCRPGGVS